MIQGVSDGAAFAAPGNKGGQTAAEQGLAVIACHIRHQAETRDGLIARTGAPAKSLSCFIHPFSPISFRVCQQALSTTIDSLEVIPSLSDVVASLFPRVQGCLISFPESGQYLLTELTKRRFSWQLSLCLFQLLLRIK
jgi:hypothetical protein